MNEPSQIKQFFDGKTVLITGGTGFVGKVLIEKLLRTTDVATLYLLIREKKGKNMVTRLDELFDDIFFDRLKSERPKFKNRVEGVAGDCVVSGLGLTIDDRQRLISSVNIVFHVAATVRFDENLKLAYAINVSGTGDVIELCKQMKQLKSLVHVSTAYCNCHLDEIEEKFYECPVKYENVGALLEKLSKSEADKVTQRLIGKWPNTYTFTKALGENLICNEGKGLPVGIFRPSIVISTYKEPIAGWIDNYFGPTGSTAGGASGLVRVSLMDGSKIADLVPVDTCVAALIASAWDVASKDRKMIPIYNYVSSVQNPITWDEYVLLNTLQDEYVPLRNTMWVAKFQPVKSERLYNYLKILYHLLPALLFDFGTILVGGKPKILSLYRKIHKFSNVLIFFALREWKFTNNNVQLLWQKMNKNDKELFPLNIKDVSWLTYFRTYLLGIRVYLLKDPLSTLPEALNRKWWFELAHNCMLFGIKFFLLLLIWNILLKFCSLFSESGALFFSYNLTNNNSTIM